jgi:GDP-4-dehydro-6-deoxy-D-mannose reductase
MHPALPDDTYMINIIVTGATGFIGKHLVPRLRVDGHKVYPVASKYGDIAEPTTWRGFPDANVVVHLAARTFVPDSWSRSAEYLRINLLGTVQALEFCRTQGARLVFLSSYMYGEPKFLPITESAELAARNPYALSKLLAEKACQFYAENFGVRVTILRPFNAYGAGQSPTFIVPSIIAQALTGATIRVMDLAPKRDYIYVKDLVEVISTVINSNSGDGIFNIGSGISHSVAELIAAIQGVLGTTLLVEAAAERRTGEIMDTVADITAARHALGWEPRFSLHEGLADMLRSP